VDIYLPEDLDWMELEEWEVQLNNKTMTIEGNENDFVLFL
jgi:hypothetical protein